MHWIEYLLRGSLVMHTFSPGSTIVITNFTIVSQKCISAYYHGIWCHNNTNWHHNSSQMTTCNRKYTWLSCIQQQMLFEVLRIYPVHRVILVTWPITHVCYMKVACDICETYVWDDCLLSVSKHSVHFKTHIDPRNVTIQNTRLEKLNILYINAGNA